LKRNSRWLSGVLRLFTAFFILVNSPALAEETAKRVLILPLTIHSEKDLTFLNKGIMDMMASRIGAAATVIRKDALAPGKDPIQMGRDLDADYVVTGSLTLFGNSASTDAALTDVETGDAALQFNQFGQSSGDVLMHINQFATQAGQYLASQSAQTQVAAPAPAQVQPAPSVAAPVAPAPAPARVTAPSSAAVSATPESEPLWTSNPFKGIISALATGDVDGNGRPDIVFIHESRVVVETKNGDRLDRLAAFDVGKRHTIVALDAGDINGNGKAEIFVTRLDAHNKLDSMVLEYNGSSLQPIAGDQPWYFRVGDDPEKGPILMGQRRSTPSATDTGGLYETTHFLPGVFELTWTGKEYRAGRRLPLPGEMTLYRFARGDIFNDGKTRAIAYSPDDKLRITTPTGSPQWAGHETLGGNPMFLKAESSTDTRTTDHTYLTQRLVPADLDGDGTVEVVTVHNYDAAKGLVERFRQYTRGRVVALHWNKVNMKEVWSGEEISGYISDFSVADLNGDGRLEAVYAMVTSTGLMQIKSSNIVVEQIVELSGK